MAQSKSEYKESKKSRERSVCQSGVRIRESGWQIQKDSALATEIGIRLVKSLLFWGLAIALTASAYTDIAKIGGMQNVLMTGNPGTEAGEAPGVGKTGAEAGEAPGAEKTGAEAGEAPGAGKTGADVAAGEELAAEKTEADVAAGENRQVALTFDDGPHPRFTKELLDGLAQRGVCATFFVVGKNIPGNEELIARMQQEGHLVGNHTYDHVKISDLSGEAACEQVEKTSELVREITGEDTEFVRPPFGEWRKDMECSFTMIPVLWNVDPLDWTTKNTALIEQRILDDTEDGDIILMHDYYQSSVDAALHVVDQLQAQGYEFVTVDKLILE